MPCRSDRQKHVETHVTKTWNNTDVWSAVERPSSGLFSGLVVIAGAKLPIPSRTRPISAPTPMVLRLKTWESRSPPDLKRDTSLINDTNTPDRQRPSGQTCQNPAQTVAGWSSPVARQAHNLKVTGSNPVPATTVTCLTPAPTVRASAFAAKPPLHNDNIAASSPKSSILCAFGAFASGCRITVSVRPDRSAAF